MGQVNLIWQDGQFIPEEEATVSLLSHSLHYGSGAFEGIRFYDSDKGPHIFRLKAHVDRLFYSASVLGMAIPYSPEAVCDIIIETVSKNQFQSGYIRPLAFWKTGELRIVSKSLKPSLMVACWQMGEYLSDPKVAVKVADMIRIHPQSTVADAKLCGNYINSILASREIAGTNFHEVLLKDYQGYIAEGAGENFFYIKDGTLFTPRTGNILPGITRATIIELAQTLNLPLEEKNITVDEALLADEAFFTGTAVEITAITQINDTILNHGEIGPITREIQSHYQAIITGQDPAFEHYLTAVPQ